MNPRHHLALPRRKVVAAGLGALAGGLLGANRADARIALVRGVFGGGLAKIDGGEEPGLAHLSLFASAVQFPEGRLAFIGGVRWLEAGTGLMLESTEITECVGTDEHPGARRVSGRMTVNGAGDYPFVLTAVEIGPPGSGQDTIELEVNGPNTAGEGEEAASDDFTYSVAARLVAGDFQVVSIDTETTA